MNENSKALKSGVWYTISNFLLKSIGFLTTPIFTRLISQADFGDFNNFSSWLQILIVFVSLNLESTLVSAKFDYKNRFDNYITSVLALSILSATIWLIVLNVFFFKLFDILSMRRFHLNCMLIYLLTYPGLRFFQIRERCFYRYKATVLTNILLSIGTAVLSVFLVVCMSDKLTGRIIGYVAPAIFMGTIVYAFFFIHERKIDLSCWKYAIHICIPYIPHLLSLHILNSMDRIMIRQICGAEDTALYSLAYMCGSIITILLVSMNEAFSPWLGDKLYRKEYGVIRIFSKKYILLFFCLAYGAILAAPEILLILGGESYLEAKYVMPPVAMGCMCQFVYTMFVNIEQINKKTIGMAIASVSAALINYGLNAIFIPKYGFIAAAYTTLAGFIWLLLSHMFIVYKMKMSKVYDYAFIGIVMLVSLGFSILANGLYRKNGLRHIVLGVYIISLIFVAIYFKKLIKKVIAIILKKEPSKET
ncbi:MAG: oligosaccharide flippase family protein [Lachnospiraceae bacterium]|nr:oligosaccharide flippase family protein [Lachnospiraceae bacterium]